MLWFKRRSLALGFLAFGAGFISIILFIPSWVIALFGGYHGGRILSIFDPSQNLHRLYMWQAAKKVILLHPIIGSSDSGETFLDHEYQLIERNTGHIFDNDSVVGVHNIYLQFWVDYGILGLSGLLVLLIGSIYLGVRYFHQVSKLPNQTSASSIRANLALGIASALVAIMVVGWFENFLRSGMQKVTIWLWLGLLYSFLLYHKPHSRSD